MPSEKRGPVRVEDGHWQDGRAVEATQHPPAPHAPVLGDVLIRMPHAGSHPPCALSAFPGPDQIVFGSVRVATSCAEAYARSAGVDVWEDLGTGHLVRLCQFRAGSGGPMPVEAEAVPVRRPPARAVAALDAASR